MSSDIAIKGVRSGVLLLEQGQYARTDEGSEFYEHFNFEVGPGELSLWARALGLRLVDAEGAQVAEDAAPDGRIQVPAILPDRAFCGDCGAGAGASGWEWRLDEWVHHCPDDGLGDLE